MFAGLGRERFYQSATPAKEMARQGNRDEMLPPTFVASQGNVLDVIKYMKSLKDTSKDDQDESTEKLQYFRCCLEALTGHCDPDALFNSKMKAALKEM